MVFEKIKVEHYFIGNTVIRNLSLSLTNYAGVLAGEHWIVFTP